MSDTKPIHSMTGFCSVEGSILGQRMRLEIKTLNHRFLDIKLRLPREFASSELPLRSTIQANLSRGVVEVKLDRITDPGASSRPQVQANLALAASYFEVLVAIQKTLGLKDTIRSFEVASLPDVITHGGSDFLPEEAWAQLEPLARNAIARLGEMRAHEGQVLSQVLLNAVDELDAKANFLRKRRTECEELIRKRLFEKIKAVFEAYPLAEASSQTLLESRLAQELAMLIERTDIEEELTRFKSHLDHFRKTMKAGGPVGRKLDFLLQELNREINTMGNKAQDLLMSEEVVQIKVRLEQLREQVMNLE